jgi:sporulation protein YunB
LDNQIVIYNNSDVVSIDFNTSILNSISSNAIRKIQKYLYMLEHGELEEEVVQFLGLNVGEENLKKGIVYEIPFTRVFNNILMNNLGLSFPVRYRVIGDLKGKIVTSIKEYGINNALIEINLEITARTMVSIPMISEEIVNVIVAPLVVKVIQGEIPDAFIGENILGEVR